MLEKIHFRATFVAVAAALSMWSNAIGDELVEIEQGWSANQKKDWYTLSQGSRLIPLVWLRSLEQADSQRPFLLREHTERFRYLLNASPDPMPLPVGFAIDTQNDSSFSEITKLRWRTKQSNNESWVGMNCAACHTNEITFNGKKLRIEGAPTLADFQGFMKSLNLALVATQDDKAKWTRFAAKVLKGEDDANNRKLLQASMERLVKWQLRVEQANYTDLDYGFARLDAFGHIFNKILLRTAETGQPTNPADAPVSYPFLWNIHQHDKVQWNGIAANFPLGDTLDLGALGRNIGEVTGVFADVTLLPPGPAIFGYPTSANVKNLLVLERQISTLKPPVWPAVFPPINADKWEVGKRLFYKQPNACANCHDVMLRDDLTSRIKAQMTRLSGPQAIGTDPWMACNAFSYEARSGALRHTPEKFFVAAGRMFGERESVADLLGTAVIGSIWYRGSDVLSELPAALLSELRTALLDKRIFEANRTHSVADLDMLSGIFVESTAPSSKENRLKRCMDENETSAILAYKARPLNGIWATPPYLHNGSVPTLFDLLLPPRERPTSFNLGTREFDPERVGFVTNQSNPIYLTEKAKTENSFVFKSIDALGRPIAGNSNLGHDYGNVLLRDSDREALVEYMKAVGATRVGDRVVP